MCAACILGGLKVVLHSFFLEILLFLMLPFWELLPFAALSLCASYPCQNGATCAGDLDQYICLCRDGYFGKHCEMGKFFNILTMDLTFTLFLCLLSN